MQCRDLGRAVGACWRHAHPASTPPPALEAQVVTAGYGYLTQALCNCHQIILFLLGEQLSRGPGCAKQCQAL